MTMSTKVELLRAALTRYLKADKQAKTKILDELSANTGLHRKSVIRSLERERGRDPWKQPPRKRGPKTRYGPAVTAALEELWEMSGMLCAERLQAALTDYLTPLQRDGDWSHSRQATKQLLGMSEATLKRRIATFRKARHPRGISTTKPSQLKEVIPIRRGPWENPRPGDGEIDTAVHCGSSLLGDMAYTVNFISIATDWNECAAQLNKGERVTLKSIETIEQRLPWKLTGLDPDSGSEFINWHLKDWCDGKQVDLTRSRPNHKNDNAHVEQKNYTAVRKLLGYTRIETPEAVTLMNELYAGPWRLFVNFFQPTMKCVKKERIGSRYVRRYDTPKTPYQRVLEQPDIDPTVKDKLTALHTTLNPLVLRREIDRLVGKILKCARR